MTGRPEPAAPFLDRVVSLASLLVALGVVALTVLVVSRSASVGIEDGRRFARAEHALRQGRADEARAGFARFVADHPDETYARYWLYCATYWSEDLAAALPELQESIVDGLPVLWLREPRCQEGKLLAAGFVAASPDGLLVRLADPDRHYLPDREPLGSVLPSSASPEVVVCWNRDLGLHALAERQEQITGAAPSDERCEELLR